MPRVGRELDNVFFVVSNNAMLADALVVVEDFGKLAGRRVR